MRPYAGVMIEPEIGQRVRDRIDEVSPNMPQRQIAELVGMTPDAFSRALAGIRGFSSLELARIADLLEADIYALITGEPDPHRLVVAARHDFDLASGRREVPGRDADEGALRDVELAYRQAYQSAPLASSTLPSTAARVVKMLGDDFVRQFADRLEFRMGVDVVRLPGLTTSYCLSVAGRKVIVLAATGNWFRENWSIAHELGHLVLGHLDHPLPCDETSEHEQAANGFAAETLLPAEQLRAQDWSEIDTAELARRVWDSGVSTDALARRLSSLGVPTSELVSMWACQPTQRLLRRHWTAWGAEGGDAITQRMDSAATRRFPVGIQDAHLAMIASGDLGTTTLCWMLGIPTEELEVDTPAQNEGVDSHVLALALGL